MSCKLDVDSLSDADREKVLKAASLLGSFCFQVAASCAFAAAKRYGNDAAPGSMAIGRAAEILDVSVQTVRNWIDKHDLEVMKTSTGRMVLTRDQVYQLKELEGK